MPGTACDDGNVATINDVLTSNCICAGQDSTTYDCLQIANGPNMPGTPCNDNDPFTVNDTWTIWCNCAGDTLNYDCNGVLNGPAMPGTACTTFLGDVGIWGSNCVCDTIWNYYDCLQVLNGPNMPGTACSTPAGVVGTWTAACYCDADSTNTGADCLGILNGPNVPGSPCWMSNNAIGVWDSNCGCSDSTIFIGCQASFWVLQAYEGDSLNPNGGGAPIPYELWVWNLSQGTDPMSYSWSFGDGTGSTDPYPTHTYSGNGPYLMCLTIADATGCTSTTCDSISIDNDGILNGMVINDEANGNAERVNGFTINVHDGLTTSVAEVPALSELHAWPNPASGELNLSFNARQNGAATVTILDVNGREVAQLNRALSVGRNQQRLDLGALPAGVYTVRIADRSSGSITTLRFVTSR